LVALAVPSGPNVCRRWVFEETFAVSKDVFGLVVGVDVGVGSRSTTPVVMEDFRCWPAATTGSSGGEGGALEQGEVYPSMLWSLIK